MKIYCETFKKWIKVLETYQEKGDTVRESIYLNFKDSYCYFASSEGIGRIKFYFEKSDDEEIPNFLIDSKKFLNIISQYDDINLNKDFVFSNKKDKYKISVIVDDTLIDTDAIKQPFDGDEIEFSKEQVELIYKTSTFTNKDETNSNYRNVFIKDNFIVALTTPTPMFESKFDFASEVILSLNVTKTITIIGTISEGCFLCSKDGTNNRKILSRDRELELIVPGCSSVDFPPNRSDKFISSYKHGTILSVNPSSFLKTLQTLRPYYLEVVNSKISISINDDLLIKVNDTQNEIEKHVEYISCDEKLKGIVVYFSAERLERILSSLKGEELFVDVPIDENKPVLNFWTDDEQHILATRFKE